MVSPPPEYAKHTLLLEYLIHRAVLDVDAAGVVAIKVANRSSGGGEFLRVLGACLAWTTCHVTT
jgi:hypothetical protein